VFIVSQEDNGNRAGQPKFHVDTENTGNRDAQAGNKAHSRVRVVVVFLVIALVIGAASAGYYYYWQSSHRGNPLNFR
jgi:hypothetical protein